MLNNIVIMGRMVKSVEIKTSNSGKEFCTFSIAHQKNTKNQMGEYETDFINCIAFSQTANFLERYFNKGDLIIISGILNIRSYINKDGVKQTVPEIVVKEAHFGSSKKDSAKENSNFNDNGLSKEEDLPF